MSDMSIKTDLQVVSCWCGASMALSRNLIRNAMERGTSLHCPATGHTFNWKSENEKLRKELDRERARNTAVTDQLASTERQKRSLQTQLTKTRQRAKAGVCPCCKRSFVQLARHMTTKHPGFDPKAET